MPALLAAKRSRSGRGYALASGGFGYAVRIADQPRRPALQRAGRYAFENPGLLQRDAPADPAQTRTDVPLHIGEPLVALSQVAARDHLPERLRHRTALHPGRLVQQL